MRISDWSSDVCSSDLSRVPALVTVTKSAPRNTPSTPGTVNRRLASGEASASAAAMKLTLASGSTSRPGRNFRVAGFGVVSVWINMIGSVQGHWKLVTGSTNIKDEDCGESWARRSEEHTSELQSLMRISYAVFCSKKKKPT